MRNTLTHCYEKNFDYGFPYTSFSDTLASSPTPEEIAFHKLLRSYQLANQVLFQTPIGNYIVDFLFPKKKLVIEIDGLQHLLNANYDLKRTEYLNKQGLSVIRFTNTQVIKQPFMVYYRLNKIFKIKRLRKKQKLLRNTYARKSALLA